MAAPRLVSRNNNPDCLVHTSEAKPSRGASVPLVSTTLWAEAATVLKATAGFMLHRQSLNEKPGRKESSAALPSSSGAAPLLGRAGQGRMEEGQGQGQGQSQGR